MPEFLRKYGLFFPAVLWIPVFQVLPELLYYWRYVSVAAIIAAAFLGRSELRRENPAGYARAHAALLANVAGLIAVSMLFQRLPAG